MATCVSCDADLAALIGHGAACVKVGRRSKKPLGMAWQTTASTSPEVVGAWLESGYNVGILLGHGGLIDVEFDDAAGKRIAKQMRLPAMTPTWTSHRGEHRLFRLVDALPPCGWVKHDTLEVRLGGKPAQSVLPPSHHPDGGFYRWLISPQECEPAPITLAQLWLEVG